MIIETPPSAFITQKGTVHSKIRDLFNSLPDDIDLEAN